MELEVKAPCLQSDGLSALEKCSHVALERAVELNWVAGLTKALEPKHSISSLPLPTTYMNTTRPIVIHIGDQQQKLEEVEER